MIFIDRRCPACYGHGCTECHGTGMIGSVSGAYVVPPLYTFIEFIPKKLDNTEKS